MDDTPSPASAPDASAPAALPPFSGLAITALVLSFITGFFAIAAFWQASLIPIAIAAIALVNIARTKRRGRILAIFAIGIAFAFGSCSYFFHHEGREGYLNVARGMLSILSDDKRDAAAKDEALTAWTHPDAIAADPAMLAAWRASFEAMETELGPWRGSVEPGDHVPGVLAMIVRPKHGAEIRPPTDAEPPANGLGIWVQVPFEQGTVWLCIVLGSNEEEAKASVARLSKDGPSACARGMRYFRLE